MAEESMFWAGRKSEGAIGDAGGYSDTQFAEFVKGIFEERTGVLSGLVVKESSPAGASVTITRGKAIIRGRLFVLDADKVVAIGDNTSGNPRKDRVILRCSWSGQTITAEVIAGTPAASPTPPTLTQIDGTTWELSLGVVDVANGFSSILEADITRDRIWARNEAPGDRRTSWNPNLEDTGIYYKADGRSLSPSTDVDLFDALGTSHGGDGTTSFLLPKENGRTFAALDDQGTAEGAANAVTDVAADTLGGTLGEEKHALTGAENGPHNHTVTATQAEAGVVASGTSGGSKTNVSITTSTSGSGTPHNIVQPTIFGYVYIRR